MTTNNLDAVILVRRALLDRLAPELHRLYLCWIATERLHDGVTDVL